MYFFYEYFTQSSNVHCNTNPAKFSWQLNEKTVIYYRSALEAQNSLNEAGCTIIDWRGTVLSRFVIPDYRNHLPNGNHANFNSLEVLIRIVSNSFVNGNPAFEETFMLNISELRKLNRVAKIW